MRILRATVKKRHAISSWISLIEYSARWHHPINIQNIRKMSKLTSPSWPVQANLFRLTCQGWPVPADLSHRSCPGCTVWLTCPGLTSQAIVLPADLSRLTTSLGCPVLAGLSRLNFLGCLGQAAPSRPPFSADLSRLKCPSWPVQAICSAGGFNCLLFLEIQKEVPVIWRHRIQGAQSKTGHFLSIRFLRTSILKSNSLGYDCSG